MNDQEPDKIKSICNTIDRNKIPAIKYNDLPSENEVKHFSGASFILLDWKLYDTMKDEDGRVIPYPEGFEQEQIDSTISFFEENE